MVRLLLDAGADPLAKYTQPDFNLPIDVVPEGCAEVRGLLRAAMDAHTSEPKA